MASKKSPAKKPAASKRPDAAADLLTTTELVALRFESITDRVVDGTASHEPRIQVGGAQMSRARGWAWR